MFLRAIVAYIFLFSQILLLFEKALGEENMLKNIKKYFPNYIRHRAIRYNYFLIPSSKENNFQLYFRRSEWEKHNKKQQIPSNDVVLSFAY